MIEIGLFALLGAFFQEVLYWYQVRTRLSLKAHRMLLGSPQYWGVTLAMVLLTPAVVYALLNGDETTSNRTSLLMGAGLPLIFKNLVAAFVQLQARVQLGSPPSPTRWMGKPGANYKALVWYFGWKNE